MIKTQDMKAKRPTFLDFEHKNSLFHASERENAEIIFLPYINQLQGQLSTSIKTGNWTTANSNESSLNKNKKKVLAR